MKEKRINAELIKLLTAEELYGILNQPEDDGSFVLDLEAAREERAEELLRKHWMVVNVATSSDLRVVVGSGGSNNNVRWIHTEKDELNLLRRSDWERLFTPNSISAILAEHVWEHAYTKGR